MNYKSINLMLPTYRRIKCGRFLKFIRSAIAQADDLNNICVTILINEDDEESQEYFKNPIDITCDYQVLTTNLYPPSLAKFFNQLYNQTKFNSPQTIVSMLGDDMVFITKGYDTAILNKINEVNGVGIVYCDDDHVQHEHMCVNLFTTRKLVSATGKPFMCELYPVDYIDTVWFSFSEKLGIKYYMNNIRIKHEHALGTHTWLRLRDFYSETSKNICFFESYVNELLAETLKSGILQHG